MHKTPVAAALLLAASFWVRTAAPAASTTPLLDYAQEQSPPTASNAESYRTRLQYLELDVARHPPPESGCAHTLGAARFARVFEQLGSLRSATGDARGAAEAYRKALACQPRATYLYADLGAELMNLQNYDEARAIAERGLALDAGNLEVLRILGQLDFIQERWPAAIARFETIVVHSSVVIDKDDEDEEADEDSYDSDNALYWKLFLRLAQERAGVTPAPAQSDDGNSKKWPQPILATLNGHDTETGLRKKIEKIKEPRRREMLCEALYYLGEERLAAGKTEEAQRYFAATVNLKVLYFIEYRLALAELAKLRARRS